MASTSGSGWGVASWAVCDPAELPADVTDTWWIQVWTEEDGTRVPTTKVFSFDGPEHCDWQDMVFLEVGEDSYLRDPSGEMDDWTRGPFEAAASLPDDARATGWIRDGRELWTVPSGAAAYLVSVDDAEDVEKWPSAKDVGCA